MARLAIVGSTGLTSARLLVRPTPRVVPTMFGDVDVEVGEMDGREVVYMTRSGRRAPWPPHRINFRANIAALKSLEVSSIVATSIVGSLRADLSPGTPVILDQFLDFTRHRTHTWFGDDGFAFVDFTNPYCPRLREALREASNQTQVEARLSACYVGVDGPRYETAAEVRMFASLGGDVIGMTNIPEVVLAREAGLCYAAVAMVSNYGAGISPRPITREENYRVTIANVHVLERILRVLPALAGSVACCTHFASDVLMPGGTGAGS